MNISAAPHDTISLYSKNRLPMTTSYYEDSILQLYQVANATEIYQWEKSIIEFWEINL